jgi:hypothetical protein
MVLAEICLHVIKIMRRALLSKIMLYQKLPEMKNYPAVLTMTLPKSVLTNYHGNISSRISKPTKLPHALLK